MRTKRKLLITLSRAAFEAPAPGGPVAVLDGPGWAWLAGEARRHRVHGSVLAALRAAGLAGRIPEPERAALEARAAEGRARAAVLLAELRSVLDRCRSAGVVPLVQRGPVIRAAYREPDWRWFRDFDLLIAEEEREPVAAALRSVGYVQGRYSRATGEITPLDDSARRREGQERHLHAFVKPMPDGADAFIVEPHVRWFTEYQPHRLPVDGIVARGRASPSPLGTLAGLPTLQVTDFLLELCIHCHGHATALPAVRGRVDLLLYRCLDIAVLLTRHGGAVDWGALAALVLEHEIREPVYFALQLAARLYGTVPPAGTLAALRLENFVTRRRQVWYFDGEGRHGVVGEVSGGPLDRLFDPGPSEDLRRRLEAVPLDESRVTRTHRPGRSGDG